MTEVRVWGDAQQGAVDQMQALVQYGDVFGAALMADHHLGYSQPIGGVVAYRNQVSPSGVGFDIACGNKAVRTDLTLADVIDRTSELADRIFAEVEFGVGRNRPTAVDHDLFDDPAWEVLKEFAGKHTHDRLKAKARNQLGTVGSGNHYCDIFVETSPTNPLGEPVESADMDAPVWVGVHFGSRGLGHNIATGFLKLGVGMGWDYRPAKGERYEREEPTLFDLDSDLGRGYEVLMNLAGRYAYAGRDDVVGTVVGILGGSSTFEVHNHHNFAWREKHGGEDVVVIRKGATPLFPGQQSFIGGSMCGPSVIVEGLDSEEAVATMRSTVHGAGRIMGRMEAKGKRHRKTGELLLKEDGTPKRVGKVTPEMMAGAVARSGIELRGGGLDESPFVYRELPQVLEAHKESTKVLHTLRPLIVCMAGDDVQDPYKD